MGTLPNAGRAIISRRKLSEYLLSPSHPLGRYKAAWLARLGYSRDDWQQLETDLRASHLQRPAEEAGENPFGTKHTIVGPLRGPSGEQAMVVSTWIVRRGEDAPRLVTLYRGSSS